MVNSHIINHYHKHIHFKNIQNPFPTFSYLLKYQCLFYFCQKISSIKSFKFTLKNGIQSKLEKKHTHVKNGPHQHHLSIYIVHPQCAELLKGASDEITGLKQR